MSQVCAGVHATLSRALGRQALVLYRRYYRAYAKAFAECRASVLARAARLDEPHDLPASGHGVGKAHFRLLLLMIGVHATWLELFAYVVGGYAISEPKGARPWEAGATPSGHVHDYQTLGADHRVVHSQWDAQVGRMREAGKTWAPFVRLRDATRADFNEIDASGKGYIDYSQFCAWLRAGERAAGTPIGADLADHEPLSLGDRSLLGSYTTPGPHGVTPMTMLGDHGDDGEEWPARRIQFGGLAGTTRRSF